MDDIYNSDDGFSRTPPLRAQTINYRPAESPPPFLPPKASSSSSSLDESPEPAHRRSKKTSKKRRRRAQASQGDAVLIGYLDPNRPDIAREAGRRLPSCGSDSEEEESRGEDQLMVDRVPGQTGSDQTPAEPSANLEKIARDALFSEARAPLDGPEVAGSMQRGGISRASGLLSPAAVKNARMKPEPDKAFLSGGKSPPGLSSKGRRTPHIKTSAADKSDDESLATSPALRQFLQSAPAPGHTLPAIQKSPQSASASSPDGNQTSLPSLQSALADTGSRDTPNPINGPTSPIARAFPPIGPPQASPPLSRTTDRSIASHFAPPPSPFSQLSPPGSKDLATISPATSTGSTNPELFRSSSKPEPMNTPSTSDCQPTPSLSTEGPNAYPTPKEHGPESEKTPPLSGPLPPNGPFTSSGFKCTHPGCNAPPFQTQYLLNSHANVHSSNRPHYCPVKDCPRGIGGKGFKRKNEMIRHGLVHDSPGYVCPFCPDQQHRYPRPDNLQRHVRVHHVDKDRDDARLREVLSLRPAGGSRGRRRRIGPT